MGRYIVINCCIVLNPLFHFSIKDLKSLHIVMNYYDICFILRNAYFSIKNLLTPLQYVFRKLCMSGIYPPPNGGWNF